MMIEARFHRARAVVFLPVAGQRDQERRSIGALLPQPPRDFIAVHAGQADIDHRHVRREHLGDRHRLRAVAHGAHFVAFEAQEHGDAFRRIDVVVDHQHALSSDRSSLRLLLRKPIDLGNLADARQYDAEERSLADAVALHLDAALVQLDEALDHGEPDAEAALAAIKGALALGEELEHMRQQLRVDADAVVAYGDHGLAAVGGGAELDAAAFAGVLGAVVEQVADHLREAREIAVHPDRRAWQVDEQRVPLGIEQSARGFHAMLDHLAELDRLLLQADLALGDARHIQEIVHQLGEMRHLALHHLARPGDSGIRGRDAPHHLRRIADGRERVAQLV